MLARVHPSGDRRRRQRDLAHCPNTGTAYVLEADKLATGALVWTKPGVWDVQRGDTDAAATGHHIYARLNGTGPVTDINPANGATRFTLPASTAVLAVDSSRGTYANCNANDLCAYNIATGALIWTAPNEGAPNAAEADGVLYLSSGLILATTTGKTLANLPLYSQNTNLVAGDGRIAAIDDSRIIDLYGLTGS